MHLTMSGTAKHLAKERIKNNNHFYFFEKSTAKPSPPSLKTLRTVGVCREQ